MKKIQITENDIRMMAQEAIKKIVAEMRYYDDYRDEDFTPGPDETYTIDMPNLVGTLLCEYFLMPEHKEEGMQFMQRYYSEGLNYITEHGYEEMIDEACGNAVVIDKMPSPLIKINAYDYHRPSGDYYVPDDDGTNYVSDKRDLAADIKYLQSLSLPAEVIQNIQETASDYMEDPENNTIDYRY